MLQRIRTDIFKKPDEGYLAWIFPKNKSTLINGLIFTFITITALSLVDYLYYAEAYYSELQPAQIKPFKIDSYFRLIFVPLLNIIMIILARSSWNNSIKRLELLGGVIIFASLFTFIGTALSHPYYSADDFTFDILVLLIFTQTVMGLTFRASFFINTAIVIITLTYLWIDDLAIKIQMYNTTLILLVWIPVLIGTLRLEKSKFLNFKTISKLQNSNTKLSKANQAIADQKKLLKAGENVSQLATWKALGKFKTLQYSDGIYEIYEFDKTNSNAIDLHANTLQMIHPEDLERVILGIQKLDEKNINRKPLEYRIVFSDGRIKWLRYTIGEYRKNKGIIGTVQDITKSKILELDLQNALNQLKIKNEDLQQFAYASSHDLQEPLRTITNFGNMLKQKLGNQLQGDQLIYLDYILQSTARMSDLIHAILEYSRIGRNKKKEKFDCNDVLSNVLNDLAFSIHENNGLISSHKLPTIIGYQAEFRTLLQNLIGNALKFHHPDRSPIIQISCQSKDTAYQFTITDNGIGIAEKYIHKIFHLFSRLHGKEDYQGTGIGLTHSKKIVELHGGKIWVVSQQAEGTIFHFTISKNLNIPKNEKEIELHHAY